MPPPPGVRRRLPRRGHHLLQLLLAGSSAEVRAARVLASRVAAPARDAGRGVRTAAGSGGRSGAGIAETRAAGAQVRPGVRGRAVGELLGPPRRRRGRLVAADDACHDVGAPSARYPAHVEGGYENAHGGALFSDPFLVVLRTGASERPVILATVLLVSVFLFFIAAQSFRGGRGWGRVRRGQGWTGELGRHASQPAITERLRRGRRGEDSRRRRVHDPGGVANEAHGVLPTTPMSQRPREPSGTGNVKLNHSSPARRSRFDTPHTLCLLDGRRHDVPRFLSVATSDSDFACFAARASHHTTFM